MPQITVAAVRGGYQANATDDRNGIDYAIVQDAAGKPYDVYVSDTDAGRKRLSARVRAARALDEADRKSTRLPSSHDSKSRMPSSA